MTMNVFSCGHLPGRHRPRPLVWLCLLLVGALPVAAKAGIITETVYFDLPQSLAPDPIPIPTAELANQPDYPEDSNRLTLVARLYRPDPNLHGSGPKPAVLVLHGSGGLWSNDIIANGPVSQFKQWGELLAGMGYLVLFPDSYNPRGIPANFSNRRPHYDPAIDDHLCSPNYERPKDVVAALAYLRSRNDVAVDRIALMGFSHGAQTAMNAVVDPSVDLGQYTVSYIDSDGSTINKNVDSPVRIDSELPFPQVSVFYYGGGGHYGYHGSPNDTGAGRFMFDRRTKVLLLHGTADYLMGIDDTSVTPMTGKLYPIKQVLASSAQAAAEGIKDPLQHHFLFDQATHSFDLASIAPEADWNSDAESSNQKAKRLGRDEVLKYFETYLRPAPQLSLAKDTPQPGDAQVSSSATNPRAHYQWLQSDDLNFWSPFDSSFDGTGGAVHITDPIQTGTSRFFRLQYSPIAPPFDDPDHSGFFRFYSDFSL